MFAPNKYARVLAIAFALSLLLLLAAVGLVGARQTTPREEDAFGAGRWAARELRGMAVVTEPTTREADHAVILFGRAGLRRAYANLTRDVCVRAVSEVAAGRGDDAVHGAICLDLLRGAVDAMFFGE